MLLLAFIVTAREDSNGKEVSISMLEKPGESTKSEKPSVADEESQQLAVKGNDIEIIDMKETENLIVKENVMLCKEKKQKWRLRTARSKERESEIGVATPPEPVGKEIETVVSSFQKDPGKLQEESKLIALTQEQGIKEELKMKSNNLERPIIKMSSSPRRDQGTTKTVGLKIRERLKKD